ncbi:hypothetical protein [Kordia sp.]|uniref:hypothetical protein n=1 Tax=Kordia sp. TaxID=1965332 RepID=UPI003D6B7F38
MKRKSLKSLNLSKKTISNFNVDKFGIKGGNTGPGFCPIQSERGTLCGEDCIVSYCGTCHCYTTDPGEMGPCTESER